MDSGRAGIRALDLAFAEVHGINGATSSIPLAGKTDLLIFQETMEAHGLAPEHNAEVRFEQCAVIGDTPRDVACAKPYGAFSLAVATGPQELAEAGANSVLENLSDTISVMEILLK